MVGMNPFNVAKLMMSDVKSEFEEEVPKIPTPVWRAILGTGFAIGFVVGFIVGWLL